jgi:hypothetical protein
MDRRSSERCSLREKKREQYLECRKMKKLEYFRHMCIVLNESLSFSSSFFLPTKILHDFRIVIMYRTGFYVVERFLFQYLVNTN